MNKAAFEKWCKNTHPNLLDWEVLRDEIWNYFHREFPREAVVKALFRYAKKIHNPELDGVAEAVDEFKRLWNGEQETTKECSFCLGTGECQGGDACHGNPMHDCPICKGTGEVCPTCRGSGEVAVERRRPISWVKYDSIEPCPDCTEKPKCLKCGYVAGTLTPVPGELCEHNYIDRRKGDRRRGEVK